MKIDIQNENKIGNHTQNTKKGNLTETFWHFIYIFIKKKKCFCKNKYVCRKDQKYKEISVRNKINER